jgi:hypothetical protein
MTRIILISGHCTRSFRILCQRRLVASRGTAQFQHGRWHLTIRTMVLNVESDNAAASHYNQYPCLLRFLSGYLNRFRWWQDQRTKLIHEDWQIGPSLVRGRDEVRELASTIDTLHTNWDHQWRECPWKRKPFLKKKPASHAGYNGVVRARDQSPRITEHVEFWLRGILF